MSNRLRFVALALAVVALVVVAGCGGSASAPPATGGSSTTPSGGSAAPSDGGSASGGTGTAVTISNFTFTPADVTVKAGESVTWTNNDSVAHTVTGAAFDSGQMAPGATYTHKFDTAGSFDYKCSIHPNMTGKVTVQ